jgi:hypothetical protein
LFDCVRPAAIEDHTPRRGSAGAAHADVASGPLVGLPVLPRRAAASADAAVRAGELPIRPGVSLKGLARLLDGGGCIGGDEGQVRRGIEASYSVQGSNVTFFSDRRGEHPVNVLPYVAGAISYAPMNGVETISGPFTGCTMAIYHHSGEARVGHVDTALPSTGEAPSKQRWADMKSTGAVAVAEELETRGMIGAFLDANEPEERFATLGVLAVATPVASISSHYAVREGGDFRILPAPGGSA